jgi:hypothetical protein
VQVHVILDMNGEALGVPSDPEVFITRREVDERWAELVDEQWEDLQAGPCHDAEGVFGVPRDELYETDVLFVLGEGIEWRRWTVETQGFESVTDSMERPASTL